MKPDELMMQLIDMADCGQGWISEDNDHPDDIPDSWREAIKQVAALTGSTIDVDKHFPPSNELDAVSQGFENHKNRL